MGACFLIAHRARLDPLFKTQVNNGEKTDPRPSKYGKRQQNTTRAPTFRQAGASEIFQPQRSTNSTNSGSGCRATLDKEARVTPKPYSVLRTRTTLGTGVVTHSTHSLTPSSGQNERKARSAKSKKRKQTYNAAKYRGSKSQTNRIYLTTAVAHQSTSAGQR